MECEKEVEFAEACHNYDIVHSIKENGTSMAVHRSAYKSCNTIGGPLGEGQNTCLKQVRNFGIPQNRLGTEG